jgi:hypothetical protein
MVDQVGGRSLVKGHVIVEHVVGGGFVVEEREQTDGLRRAIDDTDRLGARGRAAAAVAGRKDRGVFASGQTDAENE